MTYTTNALLLLDEIFGLGWHPNFTRLEEIFTTLLNSDASRQQKDLIDKIFQGSPNLKRVRVQGELKTLQFFLDAKFPLLIPCLTIDFCSFEKDEILVRKVVAPKPLVRQLEIKPPWICPRPRPESEGSNSDTDDRKSDDEIQDDKLVVEEKYYSQLQLFLSNSTQSLESLSVGGPYPPLLQLAPMSLINLSRLELSCRFEQAQ